MQIKDFKHLVIKCDLPIIEHLEQIIDNQSFHNGHFVFLGCKKLNNRTIEIEIFQRLSTYDRSLHTIEINGDFKELK